MDESGMYPCVSRFARQPCVRRILRDNMCHVTDETLLSNNSKLQGYRTPCQPLRPSFLSFGSALAPVCLRLAGDKKLWHATCSSVMGLIMHSTPTHWYHRVLVTGVTLKVL